MPLLALKSTAALEGQEWFMAGMGPRRSPVGGGNAPALTDMTRRHRKPRCFVGDFEGITSILNPRRRDAIRRDSDTRETLRSHVAIEPDVHCLLMCGTLPHRKPINHDYPRWVTPTHPALIVILYRILHGLLSIIDYQSHAIQVQRLQQ